MKRITLFLQYHQTFYLLSLMLLPLGLISGISAIWIFGFFSLILGLVLRKREVDAQSPF
jgi:Zn-dependent protease with chaperone function